MEIKFFLCKKYPKSFDISKENNSNLRFRFLLSLFLSFSQQFELLKFNVAYQVAMIINNHPNCLLRHQFLSLSSLFDVLFFNVRILQILKVSKMRRIIKKPKIQFKNEYLSIFRLIFIFFEFTFNSKTYQTVYFTIPNFKNLPIKSEIYIESQSPPEFTNSSSFLVIHQMFYSSLTHKL